MESAEDVIKVKALSSDRRPIECPVCQKKYQRNDMLFSRDCHGIPFRLLCYKCYRKIMGDRGYDGEYYTELDEQIDDDY